MFIVRSEVDKPNTLSDAVGGRQGWQSSQDGEKLHDGCTNEQELVSKSEVVKRKTDADAGEAHTLHRSSSYILPSAGLAQPCR